MSTIGLTIRILILAAAATLAGCADAGKVPVQSVTVQGDTFCEIMDEKLEWSINDTPNTIRGIVRLNAKRDRICGVPGKEKKPTS
ncbi:MAG: hypothetical protein ACM31O_01515 [Bacteroidota bacterium]